MNSEFTQVIEDGINTLVLNISIVYSCKYHVVWCPKYRRKILTNGIDTRLKQLHLEYAANVSVDIMEMEVIKMLKIRKHLKGKRTGWINAKKSDNFAFLKMADSIALQQSLRDLDSVDVNFFGMQMKSA